VEGASIDVHLHRPGVAPRTLATGHTDANGLFGFATPSDADSEHITLTVHAPGRNPRHLRLDGTSLGIDLRAALYTRT
jgi:hypothetical protein